MSKLKAVFILHKRHYPTVYDAEQRERIDRLVEVIHEPLTCDEVAESPEKLHGVEVIMSGWGAPLMDAGFLEHASELKAVFYGAGSVRSFVTEEFWERDIVLTSSWAANAVPVAEYTLAQIVLSLKNIWRISRLVHSEKTYEPEEVVPRPGAYGSTVGILSLGMIGRMVCERLKEYDVKVIAHDPFVDSSSIRELGAEPADLDTVFREADVVSLHTPLLDSTYRMIRAGHFASMKPWSTFINTARGGVVHEDELVDVLRRRNDLTAILDVTDPEPPVQNSPLFDLPNVVITPHIAGSNGKELRRLGRYAVDELERWIRGKPLQWRITRDAAEIMA
jgi:phosphoglycerate dehydrogenase-like enzyme